jgi:Ca2+-binding RTX toxin-like protein
MAIINAKPNRSVTGTRYDDEIHLNGGGNASGGAGNDTIYGGAGNNKLYGQDGDDEIRTGEGQDGVWGGRGNDRIIASDAGSVRAYGEVGDDLIVGSHGDDVIDGGDGNDTLFGSSGKDYLRGGTGNDTLVWTDDLDTHATGVSTYSGGAGHDELGIVAYGDGIDAVRVTITGESAGTLSYDSALPEMAGLKLNFTGINKISTDGTSEIVSMVYHGGNSDNEVVGSFRPDTFIAGEGNETFTGGTDDLGGDTFVFDFIPYDPTRSTELAMGRDVITDFNAEDDYPDEDRGGADTITFRGGEGQFTTAKVEHDGIVTYTSTDNAGHVLHVLDVISVPPSTVTDFDLV